MDTDEMNGRPLDEKDWGVLRPLLCQSCTKVFTSYGLRLDDREDPDRVEHSLAAIIGFAGGHMRGSMTVATSLSLLRRALPFPEANRLPEEKLLGWLGELANQMLGNFKHLLLDYGVMLDLSIPEIMAGTGLRPAMDRPHVSFEAEGGGVLQLYLHARIDTDVRLRYTPLPTEQQPIEGDDLVFL